MYNVVYFDVFLVSVIMMSYTVLYIQVSYRQCTVLYVICSCCFQADLVVTACVEVPSIHPLLRLYVKPLAGVVCVSVNEL